MHTRQLVRLFLPTTCSEFYYFINKASEINELIDSFIFIKFYSYKKIIPRIETFFFWWPHKSMGLIDFLFLERVIQLLKFSCGGKPSISVGRNIDVMFMRKVLNKKLVLCSPLRDFKNRNPIWEIFKGRNTNWKFR